LAFSPDGNTLAVGTEQAAHLWNLRDSKITELALRVPSPAVADILAFSSDGSRFAASSSVNIGQASVWDLRNPREPVQQLLPARVMAFSHDGNRLATSTGGNLRIWDLKNPGTPSLDLVWTGRTVNATPPRAPSWNSALRTPHSTLRSAFRTPPSELAFTV